MFRYDPSLSASNLPVCWGESDNCRIMAKSGEDVEWDEAWELLWARE